MGKKSISTEEKDRIQTTSKIKMIAIKMKLKKKNTYNPLQNSKKSKVNTVKNLNYL